MANAASKIDPKTTALLVMDYQHGILGRLAEPEKLVDVAADAVARVRGAGGHIGFVRVAFDEADLRNISPNNKGFAGIAAMGDAFRSDAPATQIHERVAPQPQDIVARKTRVGAFSTTNLEAQLRERGIATLILAGVSTSGVILSTVRDAADRDYKLFVLEDACADTSLQVHDFLIDEILPRQSDVIAAEDLGFLL